jgi:hypothetical protein
VDWAAAYRVRDATAVVVEECDYLGDFVGTGSDRPGGSQRETLKAAAARAGATDVVFYNNPRSFLVAKGYRCAGAAGGGDSDAGD